MGSLNLCHHPDRFIIRVTPYSTRRWGRGHGALRALLGWALGLVGLGVMAMVTPKV